MSAGTKRPSRCGRWIEPAGLHHPRRARRFLPEENSFQRERRDRWRIIPRASPSGIPSSLGAIPRSANVGRVSRWSMTHPSSASCARPAPPSGSRSLARSTRATNRRESNSSQNGASRSAPSTLRVPTGEWHDLAQPKSESVFARGPSQPWSVPRKKFSFFSRWLPDMDSNHDWVSQSHLCYHYTIRQESAEGVRCGLRGAGQGRKRHSGVFHFAPPCAAPRQQKARPRGADGLVD